MTISAVLGLTVIMYWMKFMTFGMIRGFVFLAIH